MIRTFIFIVIAVIFTGCDYVKIEDILLDDEHALCKIKHYTDPYTKIEYCLPKNFSNMENIHHYRVKGG